MVAAQAVGSSGNFRFRAALAQLRLRIPRVRRPIGSSALYLARVMRRCDVEYVWMLNVWRTLSFENHVLESCRKITYLVVEKTKSTTNAMSIKHDLNVTVMRNAGGEKWCWLPTGERRVGRSFIR